jgi:hypothetical protein
MGGAVIRQVTETLVSLIEAGTPDLGTWVEPVGLQSDGATPTGGRLAVFLYAIDEHAHARNRPPEFDGERYRRPPVVMRLSYVMAFYGQGNANNHLDEQARLDRVVQVLHTNPILGPSELAPPLGESIERLAVRLWSPTADERNQIWTGLGRAMRLSLYYMADAVPIVPTRADGGGPITEQRIDYAELARP